MSRPVTDIARRRYGRLVVLKRIDVDWAEVLCDCGLQKTVRAKALLAGRTKSCSCIRIESPTDKGMRFGKWTVVGDRRVGRYIECVCDCGTPQLVRVKTLQRGGIHSCGCGLSEARAKHGLSHVPEYAVWVGMRDRCSNPNNHAYVYYGGRGIGVCERWDSFEAFYEDMGSRPTPEHSIDRKNNDGNYEPNNCRWATRIEQARNKRPRGTIRPVAKRNQRKETVQCV